MKEFLKVAGLALMLTAISTSTSQSVEISQVTITEDQSVADIFQTIYRNGYQRHLFHSCLMYPVLLGYPISIGVILTEMA